MATIHLDVFEPNKALVTGPDFSAYIGFYGDQGYVELTDWDDHEASFYQVLPKLSQDDRYQRAARLLMQHVGLDAATVEVNYEFPRRRSALPQYYAVTLTL